MAQKTDIRLRRSDTAGKIPTSANLSDGELAINTSSGALYFKKSDDTIITVHDNTILHIDSDTTLGSETGSNPKVGIGTSSPSTNLEVKGGSGVNTTLRVSTDGTATPDPAIQLYRNSGAYGEVRYNPGGSISGESGLVYTDYRDDTSSKHIWKTRNAEKMRLDSVGNLGIGTTLPTEKLDINSDGIRIRTAQTPASASATGDQGQICWDANYVYVCVATNTWKRAALSTW